MTRSNNWLLHYGDLLNQYIVDQSAKIESERINYIIHNQTKLHAENYQAVHDALQSDIDPNLIGKKIILPSTYTGSPRYMNEKFQDGMAIVREFGRPHLFITMTCNPAWPEIQNELLPGRKIHII